MNTKGVLSRLSHESNQTLSRMVIYKGLDEVFKCAVLELPDRDNERSVSRICSGTYTCVRRWSQKYKWHYHVTDVEGRTLILIHFGNYYTDTRGCLLAGNNFIDINGDGFRDVTSSKKTIKRLMDVVSEKFELTIIDL